MPTLPLRPLEVDLEELAIAFEAEAPELRWYLDLESGAVILVGAEFDPGEHDGLTVTDIETDPGRFVRVPPAEPRFVLEDMAAFTLTITDQQLRESLELALSAARPDKRFKTALSWLPEQQQRWHAWRAQRSAERVSSWLAQHGLKPTAPRTA